MRLRRRWCQKVVTWVQDHPWPVEYMVVLWLVVCQHVFLQAIVGVVNHGYMAVIAAFVVEPEVVGAEAQCHQKCCCDQVVQQL